MIYLLRKESLQFFWLIFHAGLAFVSLQTKWPLIVWFYMLLASFVIELLATREQRQLTVIYFLGYVLGIEVLARGLNASPFIPHEMGKYVGVFAGLLGIIFGGPVRRIRLYGYIMLALSLPGIMFIQDFNRKAFIFNYFGPLALFLCVIYCSRQILTYSMFKQLLRVMVYSIFMLACFTFFKASQFEKIHYGVTANYEAAGGSITNQVATLFGVAICIFTLMYISRQQLFRWRIVDISLVVIFTIRGLLSFSRGGMISAFLAIIAVLIWPKAAAKFQDSQIRFRSISPASVMLLLLLFSSSIVLVNAVTNNYLLYRYQGKTQRALQTGFDNKFTVDEWTTGRLGIAISDIELFLANPIFGVGVGSAETMRTTEYGAILASHVEATRLLAEHGIFGVALVIMIFIYPFYLVWKEKNNYKKAAMILFLVMGLSATFHNAMRTLVTPVLFAFCFITLVPDDYAWLVTGRQTNKKRQVRTPQPELPSQVVES